MDLAAFDKDLGTRQRNWQHCLSVKQIGDLLSSAEAAGVQPLSELLELDLMWLKCCLVIGHEYEMPSLQPKGVFSTR
jgi:hypothetical protein